MNANIVIINGKIIQPIKPVRYFFTAVIKCGEEEIRVHIPKKLYRFLADAVKHTLTKKNGNVLVKGYIDNEPDENGSAPRIVADDVQRSAPDHKNIVLVSGVVCEVQNCAAYDTIKLGILEGRRMIVVPGIIPKDMSCCLRVFETAELIGHINGQQIIFTCFRSREG